MKHFQLKNIFKKIRPYLNNIIDNLRKSVPWKTQLAIVNKFISSIDNNE